MRFGDASPGGSRGNWLILVAMLAALGAVMGAIVELNRDGARYAEAFVRPAALRVLVATELVAPLDGVLHTFAADSELPLERVYQPSEQVLQSAAAAADQAVGARRYDAWVGLAAALSADLGDAEILARSADQTRVVYFQYRKAELEHFPALAALRARLQEPAVVAGLEAGIGQR